MCHILSRRFPGPDVRHLCVRWLSTRPAEEFQELHQLQTAFWKKQQAAAGVSAQLTSQLDAMRRGPLDERRAFAEELRSQCEAMQLRKMISFNPKDVSQTFTFSFQTISGVPLGLLRATVWPQGRSQLATAILFGAQCDPAIPLTIAGREMTNMANKTLAIEQGVERTMAIAPLPGLCQWILREKAWEFIGTPEFPMPDNYEEHAKFLKVTPSEYIEQRRAAAKCVAEGVTRPGRESLGEWTYQAARHIIEPLALKYATIEDADWECSMYKSAGGKLIDVHWMHDKSEEAMRNSVGCTASFEFETEHVTFIDPESLISDHI